MAGIIRGLFGTAGRWEVIDGASCIRMLRAGRSVVGFILALALGGCAIVWDDGNGRRHFIGLGHVSWSPGRTDIDTAVTGTDILGLGVRATRDSAGISIGYSSDRAVRIGDNTAVTMTCMTCDLNTANPSITLNNEGNKP